MSLPQAHLDEVHKRFASFLSERGQRKTPERMAVLDEIYATGDHIDADALYARLRKRDVGVSRATVYNTLELLVESELVARHQFGQHQARYERAYAYWQHDHLICIDCGEILEFCDPRLQEIQETVAGIYDFDVVRHALTVYGRCKQCECVNRDKQAEVVEA